ncbi:division/cell wall cluster transcriptional repressor MraZ [Phycicoccus sp. CSK15P-2]|uniref:division/cell wall cluster transcriptional repressor MraZ n=1 Tax=Phycicoccus sp. CSK15P-2 TaxID=2807627 RepID=UPI0027DBDB2B|nr:division/cell wall cluster transcriptional repressor MraZ [Phycicoccus sp. CSK15P-2]
MDEFLGTHTPRLDDKGRLFLPARFRGALAEGLVVTTGQEGCLYVFPTAEFHRISQEMQKAPGSSKTVRDFVRVFRASAHPDTPDKQGRVTIPAPLRGYAGLDKDCTVIGNGSRLEVWDTTRWEAYLAEVMPAYSAYSAGTEEVVPGL